MAQKNHHLIEGENFDINKSDNSALSIPDSEINEKYKKGEMRIVTEQGRIDLHSIGNLLDIKQGDKKKYILNPEYQRRKRWSNKRKSLLIESFIMNVPIPPIFLYEIEYAVYEVMDGLQRLTAIYDYYKDKFELDGLEYWRELNGRKYSDLPSNVKAGIDRRYLSSIILLEETAKSIKEAAFLKQIVFERLNSGGEKLTAQETRNALYNGVFNQLCLNLAKNDNFRKMWKLPLESDGEEKLLESESYRKMEDVELVLRFFAYRHLDKLQSQIDKFLDRYLQVANLYPSSVISELERIFVETIDLVYKVLGDDAFKIPKVKTRVYNNPVKTLYDPIMQVFSMNLDKKAKILENKIKVKDALTVKDETSEIFDARNNNKGDVEKRILYFQESIASLIH